MMMECYGGRYDGATVSTQIRNEFIWTNGKRCYRQPGHGLTLYRRVKNMDGVDVLMYVEHTYVVCGSCGAICSKRSERCMCGARVRKTAAR